MLAFGWRTMFMVMGVAGLVMAAVWYFFYRDPTRGRAHAGGEYLPDAGRSTRPADESDVPGVEALFRFRTTWGMILGYFGCIYLTWIYTAWLPGYLEIERHMSVQIHWLGGGRSVRMGRGRRRPGRTTSPTSWRATVSRR